MPVSSGVLGSFPRRWEGTEVLEFFEEKRWFFIHPVLKCEKKRWLLLFSGGGGGGVEILASQEEAKKKFFMLVPKILISAQKS